MKKWVMIWMALSLTLLTACGSGRGGQGSAHPYAWKEKSDGSVQLTIQGAPEDGFHWLVGGTEDGTIQVESVEDGTNGQAVFSITGQGLGNGAVTFTCRRESAPQELRFQITMTLQTTQKEKLKVVDTVYIEQQPAVVAGEDGPVPYTLYTDEQGNFTIHLQSGEKPYIWESIGYDDTLLQLVSQVYDESGCTLRMTGLKAGQTALVVYDLEQDFGIRLQLTVGEDGAVTVNEHQAGSYDIPADQIPGMQELKALVGDFSLPEGSRVLSCMTANWNGGGTADHGQLRLVWDETSWLCIVSKSLPLDTLRQTYAQNGGTRTETMVGGYPVTLYSTEIEQTALWTDEQGRSFALTALATGTQEKLLRAAESMIGASNAGEG